MANNKSIRILRGSNANIYKHRTDRLENGQLLFNTDKGYLTVGKNSTTEMNALPITVREVKGLFSDATAISDATTGDSYYINDDSGSQLKIYSSRGILISGDSITITGNNISIGHSNSTIILQKAPAIPSTGEETLSSSNRNAITAYWVRNATGNTTLNAASADKLNTNAGASSRPVYFSSGRPVASTSTIGSGIKPVYMNNGTITPSTSTVGSSSKPVYMNNGTITPVSDIAVTARAGLGNNTTLEGVLAYISNVFTGAQQVSKISAKTLNVD